MIILVLDIGGSGIKIGLYDRKTKNTIYLKKITCESISNKEMKKKHHKLEDVVIKYIINTFDQHIIEHIGISTSGSCRHDGVIERWGEEYYICDRLNKLGYKTCVLNDGESHLYCFIKNYSRKYFGR